MATYDSAKTRAIAREMTLLLQTLEADVNGGLRGTVPLVTELRGRTAQTMKEALEDMLRLEREIQSELGGLAHQLSACADVMERADDWLARQL